MILNFITPKKIVYGPFMFLVFVILVSTSDFVTIAETPASVNQVTLKVVNTTFKELVLFEDSLQKHIRSIKNLDRQNFDAARKSAEINVTIIDDFHQFSRELILSEFAGFEVEVLNLSAQTLEIRLNQKPNEPTDSSYAIAHKPKIMILIAERPLTNRTTKDAVETEMIRKFTEKGFKVINPAALKRNRNSNQISSIMRGDTDLAANIGRQYGAELLIVGEAFSERGKVTYGLRTCRATVEARVIEVDTMRIIVANSQNAAGADATENIASKKALQNAGGLLADYFIDEVVKEWSARAASTYDVQLVISGLTFSQLVQLEETFKKWSGVDTLYRQSFDSGIAVIELRSQHRAQKLAEELVNKPFNGFSVEVTNFTANRIDVKVERAPADYDILLVISKVTFSQLVQLEQFLNALSGVDAVYLRSFDSKVAVIEIHYEHGAQRLAGELSDESFNQFSLNVTNFTTNRIDIIPEKKDTVYNTRLVISGLTFSQLVQLEETFKKWSGVDAIHRQSFDSGIAVIELRSQQGTQKLAEELVNKPFDSFSVEVTNFTANRIDVQVERAPTDYDILLVISKVTFSQLVQLEQFLNALSGVDAVYLRSFDSGIAVIEIHYQHGAQKLAGELSDESFNRFSLDVTNFTRDRIDIIPEKNDTVYNTRLVISKLTFSQLAHLEQTLKKLSGVETVYFQGFDSGVAIIQLNSQHKVEKLAEMLISKSFNRFSLDVTNFNSDKIEIEVKKAPPVYGVQLVISKLTFNQLVQIEQALNELSSVSDVYLQSFDSDVAVVELNTQHGAQRLAEELVNRSFKRFSLDVRNFTISRINIEVIKKR